MGNRYLSFALLVFLVPLVIGLLSLCCPGSKNTSGCNAGEDVAGGNAAVTGLGISATGDAGSIMVFLCQ